MRLKDRVAFVTGGGSGIGQAICLLFAQEGAAVIAADRDRARAESTVEQVEAQGGEGLALEVDVTEQESVNQGVEKALAGYDRVDVLVNNAGISVGTDILTIDETTWDLNFDVVLKGAYRCSKVLLPQMLSRQQGAIINIASVNGMTGIGEEAYSAAKAGLINLTQNMAVRYAPQGVRSNVICPGTIQTPIWNERLASDPAVFDKLAKWYPLGRVGQPQDVARAALFLASDEAGWITGVVLPVDGGLMAGTSRFAEDLSAE